MTTRRPIQQSSLAEFPQDAHHCALIAATDLDDLALERARIEPVGREQNAIADGQRFAAPCVGKEAAPANIDLNDLLSSDFSPEVALLFLYGLLLPDLMLDLHTEFILGGFLGILPTLPTDGFAV
jgi:hypothetical protein